MMINLVFLIFVGATLTKSKFLGLLGLLECLDFLALYLFLLIGFDLFFFIFATLKVNLCEFVFNIRKQTVSAVFGVNSFLGFCFHKMVLVGLVVYLLGFGCLLLRFLRTGWFALGLCIGVWDLCIGTWGRWFVASVSFVNSALNLAAELVWKLHLYICIFNCICVFVFLIL